MCFVNFGVTSIKLRSFKSLQTMCNVTFRSVVLVISMYWIDLSFSGKQVCRKGLFKCETSFTCIPQNKNCDGTPDCSDFSDERNCSIPYKGLCACRNKDLLCQYKHLDHIPNEFLFDDEIELMDLSGNVFHTLNSTFTSELPKSINSLILRHCNIFTIKPGAFSNLDTLESLYLDNNRLSTIATNIFSSRNKLSTLILSRNELTFIDDVALIELQHLKELDLSYNYLKEIKAEWLKPLINLTILYLNNNQIMRVKKNDFPPIPLQTLSLASNFIADLDDGVFASLAHLENLFLSDNRIKYLRNSTFLNLSNLLSLNLNGNQIEQLETGVFTSTKNIVSLYLKGNHLKKLAESVFQSNQKLEYIYFNKFEMCSAVMHVRVCDPKGDGISSQYHLLDNTILRTSVWIMGLVGCIGNIIVLLRRSSSRTNNIVHSLYISNLAFSDLLMSIYLFIIAFVDMRYRGVYLQFEYMWRHSLLCEICGVLSTLSCESSVLILILITWDRFVSVTQPLVRKQPSTKGACTVLLCLWMISVVGAFAPCLKLFENYFGDEFYGSNGVCLSLHIHDPYQKGWEYSAILFMLVNLLAFTFICYAYLRMIKEIRISNIACRRNQKNQGREKIAQRFAIIVFTDCLCWVPVIVVKFIALTGIGVSENVYAWLAVLILPVNSALNPILYTLTTITFMKQLHNVSNVLNRMKDGMGLQHFDSHNTLSSLNRKRNSRKLCMGTRSSFTHSKNSLKQSTAV